MAGAIFQMEFTFCIEGNVDTSDSNFTKSLKEQVNAIRFLLDNVKCTERMQEFSYRLNMNITVFESRILKKVKS